MSEPADYTMTRIVTTIEYACVKAGSVAEAKRKAHELARTPGTTRSVVVRTSHWIKQTGPVRPSGDTAPHG